jgi:hypothetical protein
MMKDMKWKQIDTTYAGKAYQVEAEDINLHGDVNIQGSLSVNGSPLDTPTAAGTSYDNLASGLTAETVQGAIDEIAEDLIGFHIITYGNYIVENSDLTVGVEYSITINNDSILPTDYMIVSGAVLGGPNNNLKPIRYGVSAGAATIKIKEDTALLGERVRVDYIIFR